MASSVTNYQCPACTGPLHFDAASGKLACEYCTNSYTVAEIETLYAPKQTAASGRLFCPGCGVEVFCQEEEGEMFCPSCGAELDLQALRALAAEQSQTKQEHIYWDTQAGGQWQQGEAEGLRVYRCASCSGEIVADATTGATHCPYCDNPVVLSGHFSGALKPDLVIPFRVDRKSAIAALQNHYKGKLLLPKVFKDQNHIQEVKGLYVPVWLFDADVDADVHYRATRTHTWSDSEYRYTETRYYSVFRSGCIGFENVPVDGSTKMDDALMESIEPYDISGAVPFQSAYLPGYLADKYDVDADSSIERANQRIRESTQEAFRSTVQGYTSVTPTNTTVDLRKGQARYALYPVWILNTLWNGQKFTFAINGQTGKIAGDLPMDKGKFWTWLAGVSAAVTAAAFAVCYLMWL